MSECLDRYVEMGNENVKGTDDWIRDEKWVEEAEVRKDEGMEPDESRQRDRGRGCRLQKVVEGVEGVKRLRSGCC